MRINTLVDTPLKSTRKGLFSDVIIISGGAVLKLCSLMCPCTARARRMAIYARAIYVCSIYFSDISTKKLTKSLPRKLYRLTLQVLELVSSIVIAFLCILAVSFHWRNVFGPKSRWIHRKDRERGGDLQPRCSVQSELRPLSPPNQVVTLGQILATLLTSIPLLEAWSPKQILSTVRGSTQMYWATRGVCVKPQYGTDSSSESVFCHHKEKTHTQK